MASNWVKTPILVVIAAQNGVGFDWDEALMAGNKASGFSRDVLSPCRSYMYIRNPSVVVEVACIVDAHRYFAFVYLF